MDAMATGTKVVFRIQLTVVLQCDWLRAWVINHLLPMLLWIISTWS